MQQNTHINLIENILKVGKLNAEEIKDCENYFEPISFNRNTVVEEQNNIPKYFYFISSGFMRLFYYDDNGDEHTTYLTSPNNFITSFLSFIHQIKSPENIECITDCTLLRITNGDLKKLIDNSESFKKFSLVIFEKVLFSTSNRANDLATLNAEQRYKKLLETQPLLLQNVPIQYIASYLGMKPESLSRIRKQIIS